MRYDDEEWQSRAACIGYPPGWWWPEEHVSQGMANQAKAICFICPVRQECLDDAIRRRMYNVGGIWGGMGRLALRREKYRRTKAAC